MKNIPPLISFAIRSLLLCTFLVLPKIAWGVVVLQPGELKTIDNFIFTQQIINNSAVEFVRCPGTFTDFSCTSSIKGTVKGEAIVEFPPSGRGMKLTAFVFNSPINLGPVRRKEAFARGKLLTDFCVEACGGTNNETITALIRYKVGWVGRVSTFGPSSKGQFAASVRIRDLTVGGNVDTSSLENVTVGNLLGSPSRKIPS